MSNMASNRSPSPFSSRNCRNSGTNSTTRSSYNGSPFARPNALINPKSSNPPTPANTPTTTDHTKRNSINRKSMSSLFQDGKENHKEALRSPAKTGSKNFMAPTISAASKFTPSPRKKILGDKNDVTRASIQFLEKDSDFKSVSIQFLDKDSDFKYEASNLEQTTKMNGGSLESDTAQQKEYVVEDPAVHEVTLSSTDESSELLSGITEDCDTTSIRPACCSPITSPIIAPLDSDPHLPPYDPKKNFLSPRPQFLRYKPNPRIGNLLNKEISDEYGEGDVTKLEDSFNLSENSSDTEVEEQEKESGLGDLVHESSEDLIEKVPEDKEFDLKVEKATKNRFFTGSKAVSFVFLMFLVACYAVSYTDSPPMDLPIYKDVGFSEIYHESLKFAGFAKESFDGLVENLKNWSIDFVSYISYQKSQLFTTQKNSPIRFFNLTVEQEFVFHRPIGTDYNIQGVQEHVEEMSEETELMEEEVFADMEYDDDMNLADEVVNEHPNEIQTDDGGSVETKSNLEDRSEPTYESRPEMVVNEHPNEIQTDVGGLVETKSNLEDGSLSKSEPTYESRSEMAVNDHEIASDAADSNDGSEIMISVSTKSLNKICLAGVSMVILVVSAIFYMKKRNSNAIKPATVRVADDVTQEESCSSSVGNKHKKKTSNNKRDSLAVSSSDFSMGSSYGSFTTLERIPIKNKDEVMLTPIRRSSRLIKNHVL
ncbi:hypothetical protein R6Q59_020758 [Mikania micrantha]|uniref:Uncharacterized protein n=1 Tax=Mikania micrantha TaxID=192012 RepID=A0A5N6LJK3_9ASTR|nr:hypothetical protein E3N88_44794 [Mikania micrantha]KAD2093513.1 hypothetical protein E3N88_41838 [Mikania micrantha]